MTRTTTRPTTRTTTALAIGGVLAAVAVGALVATTLWGGDSDNANGSVPVTDVGSLTGSWRAINSVGAPREVVGEVRLRFADGRVAVETGCNRGSGTVEVEDSHLVAGPVVSTKMGCEAPLMEQEQWLFAMVAANPLVELSGPYLYVTWDKEDGAAGQRWWLGLEQESAKPTS